MPFLSCPGFLLVNPNPLKCTFTQAAEHIFSLMNILLMYEEVALLMTSSCPSMALTVDWMIWSAMFSPNLNWVTQYLWGLIFTVWNGNKNLSIWTCKYVWCKSNKASFNPCCYHSLKFWAHTSALAVYMSTCLLSSQLPMTDQTICLFSCSMAISGIRPFGSPS